MINTLDIYERISLKLSMSERDFIDNLNNTLNEMKSSCNLNSTDKNYLPIVYTINDNIDVDDRYTPAIIDNIIYIKSNNNEFKAEFVRKMKEANNSIWNDNAKGRKFPRKGW